MIEINVNRLTKNYGFGNIFDNISFNIHTGEIVSLIGDNGSGKSTLLKLIYKSELPTTGTISVRKNIKIGYLEQKIDDSYNDLTVKDILYTNVKEIMAMEEKLKEYEQRMSCTDQNKLKKILKSYGTLQEQFIISGGYEITEKVNKIINGFKLSHLINNNFKTLSGGEQKIVMLANLMLKDPDLLLLDEPTNHLDLDTLEWLEQYLITSKKTVIIVSHDRYFLDKISNKILYLNKGKLDIYYGNYTYFLEEYEKRTTLEFKKYKDQQKEIKAMKESIKKLREFATLGDNEDLFRRAKSIEKRLEKMEKIDKPLEKNNLPINFNSTIRTGKEVLIIKNLTIQYGEKMLLNNVNYLLTYQERVCLMGKNGIGKSSLINNIINGNEHIKLGTNIRIGYISQIIIFDKDERVYDLARKYFKGEEYKLRSALFKFIFKGNDVYKKISLLSGGEKVRLKLFCLMQQDINFLILDEPTNNIDISTREVLEDALLEFKGTILFVSHDRYFINKIATKVINIENKNLVTYLGNYDYYKERSL